MILIDTVARPANGSTDLPRFNSERSSPDHGQSDFLSEIVVIPLLTVTYNVGVTALKVLRLVR
jgi:hypothetical protein